MPRRVLQFVLHAALVFAPASTFAQDPGEPDDPVIVEEEDDEYGGAVDESTFEQPAEPLDVDAVMRRVVDGRTEEFDRLSYQFCRDDDFDADFIPNAKRFCRVWDESTLAVCPQALKLCAEEEPWWNFPGLSIPPGLAWALLIALLLTALGFIGYHAFKDVDWQTATDAFDVDDDPVALEDLASLPEAPAQTIMRRAQRAIDNGRAFEAAILTQLAMLRYFDDTGLSRFHPSRTNGDYLRSIRRHTDLHALYRSVAMQTDRLRFGDGEVDVPLVQDNVRTATTLLARQPEALPVGGPSPLATGLALLVVLATGYGCGDSSKPFYDYNPGGMAALPSLLDRAGIETTITSKPFAEVPPDAGVVVLRTSSSRFGKIKDLSLDALLDRSLDIVIIDDADEAQYFLPVTLTSTFTPAEPLPVTAKLPDGLACGIQLGEIAAALSPGEIRLPRGARMRWDQEVGRSKASEYQVSLEPILQYAKEMEASDPALGFTGIRVDYDGTYLPGCMYVFSNGQLFTNASLTQETNAQFVAGLFASMLDEGQKVVLLDTLDSSEKPESIARSIGSAKLLPFVAQSGLWLVALFIFLGAAFGPLRDPATVEHKAFVEHVEAVGRHYASAGNKGLTHSARSLARLLVMRHRHEVRSGHDAGWVSVSKHLAETYELEEMDVRAALRLGIEGISELGAPGLNDPSPSSERMLRTLSTLLSSHVRKKKV